MCDPNPTVEDGKWYTLPEARERQKQLIQTMPTGKMWYWINSNGNEVVFT